VATYLNQPGKSGIIKLGAASDLILLDGNPLQDIKHTQNIAGVMLGTNWLSKSYLQEELKKLEKP
jgi:imidazolonepropionase-like amidohydrolase